MPGQIRGIFKAASKPFESEEEVFKPVEGEIFPYRVRLKAVLVPKDPTDFRSLIPKLTFIKKKRMWGFFVRTAMREIPEGDYRTIESALV
jgi:predicted RNA-binding protein